MLIIAAANPKPETEADAQSLDRLLDEYDIAKTDSERERIAGDVYQLVGGSVRGMVARAAGNQRLNPEQLDALAWTALFRGISESGLTKIKRDSARDSDWQPQIQEMIATARTNEPSPAARVWSLLSDKTKSAISANPEYIKNTVQTLFLADLNALLRRRDFYEPAAWNRVSLIPEATELLNQGVENLGMMELSRLNALLVSAAFSEVQIPPRPPRNMLAYIKASVVPKMRSQIYELASGKSYDSTLQDARAFIEPDIAAVRDMESTGTLPSDWSRLSQAERIQAHLRQRLQQRYGPAIQWMHGQLREFLGDGAFKVGDAGSLRDARAVLDEHGIDPKLWKDRNAPHYVPTAALHPPGLRTIQRVLDSDDSGVSIQQAPQPAIATQPQEGDDRIQLLLAGGHAAPAYRWLVNRLFSRPGFEAEHAVGLFLARNPNPSRQQVEAFVETLPDELAGDVEENGWQRTAREIDMAVLDALRDRATQAELQRALGLSRQAVVAAVDGIRRTAFRRATEFVSARLFLRTAS